MSKVTEPVRAPAMTFFMKVLCLAALLLSPSAAQAQLFDDHVHLHHGDASAREYDAQLKAAGTQGVTFAAMWFGGPNQALAGKPAEITAANDGILALARKRPDMMPVATVHPYDGEAALAEVGRVAGLGFKMLNIHPHTQRFDPADPRVLDVVKRAGEAGIVVLMDNANIVPGDTEKLFNLALQAPKTTFIFAHMGGMNFRFWNILRAARTAKDLFGGNIYFDLSAISVLIADSPMREEFVWTMRSVGVDKLQLGSDYPQYTLAQNLAALDKLGLTPEERRQIVHENAERLFGLSKRPAK